MYLPSTVRAISLAFIGLIWANNGKSQAVCSPANPPVNLQSTYTPGVGAHLSWDAISGSEGVRISASIPGGGSVNKTIVGYERDQFNVPDALLSTGTYTWRVQATCNLTAPYNTTPVSAPDMFTVSSGVVCPSTVTDADGNIYPVLQYGDQCWTGVNLDVTQYNNGDPIPTGLSNTSWSSASSGAYGYYADLPANRTTYGLLYNWWAATDPRGLCPAGWSLPSNADWTTLTTYLGGDLSMVGGFMKSPGTFLTGTGLWLFPNAGATNSSGFTGLPAGFRNESGLYGEITGTAYFWTSDDFTSTNARYRFLTYASPYISGISLNKKYGNSVRCIKN